MSLINIDNMTNKFETLSNVCYKHYHNIGYFTTVVLTGSHFLVDFECKIYIFINF